MDSIVKCPSGWAMRGVVCRLSARGVPGAVCGQGAWSFAVWRTVALNRALVVSAILVGL